MKVPTGNLHTLLASALPLNDETKQSMLDEMVRKVETVDGDACAGGSRFMLPLWGRAPLREIRWCKNLLICCLASLLFLAKAPR